MQDDDYILVERTDTSVVVTPQDQVITAVVQEATVVTTEVTSTVTAESKDIHVLSVGQQGPPGPPGATISYLASGTIGGHRVVVMSAPGEIAYADNTVASHADRVVGLTTQAGNLGDPISVAKHGEEVTEPTWNWTTGQVVYLGTSGILIQSEPVLPAVFSLIVGFATSPTSLFIDVREPIFLA